MKKIFFTIIAILLPLMASAINITQDGISYYLDSSTKTATVVPGSYSGSIYIYRQVTYGGVTYTVTSIGKEAFYNSDITYVTIPNTVTSIGKRSFGGCTNLTSIIIPSSVTEIGSAAFYGCSKLVNIELPSELKVIDENLFWGCTSLTSVTIPKGVTQIAEEAFRECLALSFVIIPNSVTQIGDKAFEDCSSLKNVISEIQTPFAIPDNVFNGIPSDATFAVPDGTKAIYKATAGWNKYQNIVEVEKQRTIHVATAGTLSDLISEGEKIYLEELTLTGNLNGTDIACIRRMAGAPVNDLYNKLVYNEMESGAIHGKLKVLDISGAKIVSGGDPYYKLWEINPDGWENTSWASTSNNTISGEMFKYCNLTKVVLPDNITSIGYKAFYSCGKLSEINIPNSVTSIGNYAFSDCSGLISLTIPNSVTSIGDGAFYGCGGLTSIDIPNSVTSIDYGAFSGCSGLTSIYVNSGNTKYDSRDNCNAIIEKSSNTLVAGCKNTIIPNGVTSIGDGAFSGCSVTSIDIPNSVTSIGDGAFYGCGGLTSIDIPNSVTSIGSSAFKNCSGLTSVTIPNSVTSIGSDAFYGCNNLKYICLTSDVFPSFSTYYISTNCQLIIPQKAYESGIPSGVKNFSTYSDTPMLIQVKSKTATSAVFELRPVNDPDNAVYTVTTYGQTPGQNLRWKLDDQNYGIVSEKADETLTLEVQAAEAMSINKARLLSTVTADEPDDDQHYGFEWLRYDAPEGMNPYQVSAPLYKSQIVGALGNLNSEKYYKYRPFYKSDDGTIFRGEWTIFTTGDYYVFFEPDVHTKEPVVLSDGGIVLLLFFAEGTEEILEKGFELIKKALESFGTRSDGGDVTKVIVSGNEMSAAVEGLEPGTEYIYRSYVKTASGTTYGEEVTFKTPLPGDANNDGVINAADIVEVVNAKAGNPSASFIMTNADMDGSGSLTEADINAIVNIIMQK